MPTSASDPRLPDAHPPDSRYALWRLLVTLLIMTVGGSGMYVVSVVIPAVQADFGIDRAQASLPYTLLMIGFGVMWARPPCGCRSPAATHAPI